MLSRILFIIVFAATIPLVFLMAFVTALPMPLIALFIYIFKGDEDDNLMDFIKAPFVLVMSLPWKITGRD